METLLLTNPLTYIVILIIVIIGLLLSKRLTLSIGPLKLGFIKEDLSSKVYELSNSSHRYTNKYFEYKNNIIKNQLNYAEGVINSLDLDYLTRELVHAKIKQSIKENGFECFNTLGYSQYVGRKIDDVTKILEDNNIPVLNQHRDKVADIYNHALLTYNYWNDKITDLDGEFELTLANILK